MSEWKGPWKCRNCNAFLSNEEQVHYTQLGRCWGRGEPYDRRDNADWKAEWEFYLPQNQDLTEANNNMGPKMIQLIGALDKIVKYYDQMPKSHGYFYAEDIARAVLAEVIGEKKELPKFKDIIGLFVDKPEEEKE